MIDRHPYLLAKRLLLQATRVEFTGRISGAEITQKTAIDMATLQAISTIISRMGGSTLLSYAAKNAA